MPTWLCITINWVPCSAFFNFRSNRYCCVIKTSKKTLFLFKNQGSVIVFSRDISRFCKLSYLAFNDFISLLFWNLSSINYLEKCFVFLINIYII